MRNSSVRAWLPVLGLIVALFALPGGSPATAGGNGPLKISPNKAYYAGQKITFKGDVGKGVQTIRMQRKQSPTSGWSDVFDPKTGKPWTGKTKADGSFKFTFPAFAMNTLQIRVVGRTGKTRPVRFYSTFQEVDLTWEVAQQSFYPLPAGLAAVGENVKFTASTRSVVIPHSPAKPAPVIVGRGIAVQFQDDALLWQTPTETLGQTNTQGRYVAKYAIPEAGTAVVRPSLDNWTQGGNQIGWFPGFPTRITVVQRPRDVENLDFSVPTDAKAVDLTWGLPNQLPDAIVIHRYNTTQGETLEDSVKIATLPGTDATYRDADPGLVSGETYTYAVFTRDADGIYSRNPVTTAAVPVEPPVTP